LEPGLTALGSVVVSDGEATVDLGREAFRVSQANRPLLIAQIAASLASVPGVFSVRVQVEERAYTGGAVPVTVANQLAATSHGPELGLTASGGLVSLAGSRAVAVRWVGLNRGTEPLLGDPATAPMGDRLAALVSGPLGPELSVADLSTARQLTATERALIALGPAGGTYLQPQWLDESRILAASGGVRPQVQLVDTKRQKLHPVATPGLAALGPLSTFAISRDGTRVIAVAGPAGARQLYLGQVTPASGSANDAVSIGDWTRVPTNLADVADASWSADLAVTVVGQDSPGSSLHAEVVALDTVTDPSQLPVLPAAFTATTASVEIAAAPGRPTLISDGGRSWMLNDGQWVTAPATVEMSYP
jgi:hypothetical protein